MKLHENNFDLIRLLAALQVVYFHAKAHLPNEKLDLGWMEVVFRHFPGVPVFFVTSGFLIYSSYSRMNNDLLAYSINRILRIFPALWACLVVSIIAVCVVDFSIFRSASLGEIVPWLMAQLTIVQFYNPSFLREFGVGVLNGSLWTIPVELQFYVVLPFIFFVSRKFHIKLDFLFLLILGLSIGFMLMLKSGDDTFFFKILSITFLPHIWLFLMGAYMARYWNDLSFLFKDKALWWLIGYGGLVALSVGVGGGAGFLIHTILLKVVLCGVVIACAFTFRHLSGKIIKGEDVSYGVYIYHMVVVNVLIQAGMSSEWWAEPFVFCFTLCLAWVSWRFLERRVLGYKKGATSRSREILNFWNTKIIK